MAVASEPGHGTTITVTLPLFEAQRGSDLLGTSAR
jgi:signal transduction histidine kinase